MKKSKLRSVSTMLLAAEKPVEAVELLYRVRGAVSVVDEAIRVHLDANLITDAPNTVNQDYALEITLTVRESRELRQVYKHLKKFFEVQE